MLPDLCSRESLLYFRTTGPHGLSRVGHQKAIRSKIWMQTGLALIVGEILNEVWQMVIGRRIGLPTLGALIVGFIMPLLWILS